MTNKTQRTEDGLKIQHVKKRVVECFSDLGISVRNATRHPYAIIYPGVFPCAIGETTNVQKQVVPFLTKIPGISYSSNEIYSMIRGRK